MSFLYVCVVLIIFNKLLFKPKMQSCFNENIQQELSLLLFTFCETAIRRYILKGERSWRIFYCKVNNNNNKKKRKKTKETFVFRGVTVRNVPAYVIWICLLANDIRYIFLFCAFYHYLFIELYYPEFVILFFVMWDVNCIIIALKSSQWELRT